MQKAIKDIQVTQGTIIEDQNTIKICFKSASENVRTKL